MIILIPRLCLEIKNKYRLKEASFENCANVMFSIIIRFWISRFEFLQVDALSASPQQQTTFKGLSMYSDLNVGGSGNLFNHIIGRRVGIRDDGNLESALMRNLNDELDYSSFAGIRGALKDGNPIQDASTMLGDKGLLTKSEILDKSGDVSVTQPLKEVDDTIILLFSPAKQRSLDLSIHIAFYFLEASCSKL